MMKKVTFDDMYELARAAGKPLLFDTDIVTKFPYLAEYIDNFADFDRQFDNVMSSVYPIRNVEKYQSAAKVWEEFKYDCTAIVRRYDFNLKKLFTLIATEYKPLENFNREETTNDEKKENGTDINTYGAVTNRENLGAQEQQNDYGARARDFSHGAEEQALSLSEQNNERVNGAQSESQSNGAQKHTTSTGYAGINDDTYGNVDKAATEDAAYTDSITRQAYTDTEKLGAHTQTATAKAYADNETLQAYSDKYSKKAIVNTKSQDEHEDVLDTQRNETMKRVSSISGNIGVTTSQEMFRAEWSLIKDCNPYDVLLYFIRRDLLLLFDEGWSASNTPLQNESFMLQ